jgi:hypothetical protein
VDAPSANTPFFAPAAGFDSGKCRIKRDFIAAQCLDVERSSTRGFEAAAQTIGRQMIEADYYRQQADQCRKDAAAAVTPQARRQLDQLAAYYERQARWASTPEQTHGPMQRA